ncbi:ABC transporter ATP-binding protein [Treponema brennaborense]|uniref:Xenobiotic-transporting ATPase n=1 Tax=Treponema brennaborense (strain DSM 12168 / CIP 105900 / DD5/3) TaxID=906968 RepID=F4LNP1_TREBD|nr:ABC transporter ATP-binding protein [Treponema brennaborense]AEE16876.1 Xenobiotic-transporting ATPase [Treponema brennaborense DSM 12168]
MVRVYKKLLYYVPKEKWLAYLAIVLAAVSAVITVAAYYYMYEFLERLIVLHETERAFSFAVLITGLLAAGSVVYMVSVLLTHILGFRLETNLRKKGIDGLMSAGFKFFDLNSSGRTRQLIDDNAAQTHSIVAHLIPDNAGAVLTPVLVLAVGFTVDVKVGIALVLFTVFGAGQITLMSGDKSFMAIYQAALEKMNSETVEYIRGMQVVKIFGANVSSFKALHKAITDYSKYALDYSLSCKKPYVRFQLVFLGAVAVLIPFAVSFMDVYANPLALAVDLIMVLFLSGVLFSSFMKIMYVSMYAYMGTSAVEKLEHVFADMQKDTLQFGTQERFENYDIEFDRVRFGYGDEMILNDLSFKLSAGRSYALVGASGSGKSTIVKLISGFYKINGGDIKIGGKPLASYSRDAVAKHIAFVFQESRLFKTSIFENVRIADPQAAPERVFEALRLAGCDDVLQKFPLREQTVIGSKGVFLSGGEKQRIAIARAILKNAGIIIMDEASAAVDPENEHELQKAFKNLIKGKTVIMIAHRLSSIRAVDEVLVMEKGQIIERGSDAALLEKGGKYAYFQNLYAKANNWRVRV